MARRRPLTGTPLLVASAGVVLHIGCGHGKQPDNPMGNLMPPPIATATVCVDTVPESAEVRVNGVLLTQRCETFPQLSLQVVVEAPGFRASTQTLTVDPGATEELKVVLKPEEGPRKPEPVGNLMAPPRFEK